MRAARTTPLLALTLALALTPALACVREGAPVVAPVEVTIENGDAGATPLVVSAPPPAARDRCTARLRAAAIKTKEGCTLDERISQGNGTLLYPCSGDGPVEAIFGEHRFTGRVSEGALTLALSTELDWQDGCHWETKQAIRGELKRERDKDGKPPKLLWSYTEAPVSGTGCFGSCRATADLEADELSP